MKNDTSDSSTRPGFNVGPDWGLWRLLWIHGTTRNVTNWRIASHESLQLNTDKLQIQENDKAAHLPLFMQLCEIHLSNEVHAVRLPKSAGRSEEKRGAEKKEERRGKHVRTRIAKR